MSGLDRIVYILSLKIAIKIKTSSIFHTRTAHNDPHFKSSHESFRKKKFVTSFIGGYLYDSQV